MGRSNDHAPHAEAPLTNQPTTRPRGMTAPGLFVLGDFFGPPWRGGRKCHASCTSACGGAAHFWAPARGASGHTLTRPGARAGRGRRGVGLRPPSRPHTRRVHALSPSDATFSPYLQHPTQTPHTTQPSTNKPHVFLTCWRSTTNDHSSRNIPTKNVTTCIVMCAITLTFATLLVPTTYNSTILRCFLCLFGAYWLVCSVHTVAHQRVTPYADVLECLCVDACFGACTVTLSVHRHAAQTQTSSFVSLLCLHVTWILR